MIERIGTVDKIPQFLEDVKAKKELLFGFGHRVYRNTDPRSKIIREVADSVFEAVGKEPLIDVAIALRDAALKDDFFVSRKLFPSMPPPLPNSRGKKTAICTMLTIAFHRCRLLVRTNLQSHGLPA